MLATATAAAHLLDMSQQVTVEWRLKHQELDQQARRIELELQDRILPKVAVLDSQLADLLRQIGERFEELRFALWNVMSDRDLQAEYRQATAERDALLGLNLGEGGYSHLPCPVCREAFTSRHTLYNHFQREHPRPPMGARVLIDVGEHYINVSRTVGPLRALFREAEQRIAQYS